jgi:DNA-binding response OmpR family regulator
LGRISRRRFIGGTILTALPIILVIEDDRQIQSLVEDALRDGGFEPAIAGSGEEAITLLKAFRTKYRALVTDITLLGTLDGWRVARGAREIDPSFPIVYITGAGADEWATKGVPDSILLQKPFGPDQLVAAVSRLLDTDAPSA